jgi:hypothetical protein
MSKAAVAGRVLRGYQPPAPAELPDLVAGQISEICRDLAVMAKRMRQLQEQADELSRVFRQGTGQSDAY